MRISIPPVYGPLPTSSSPAGSWCILGVTSSLAPELRGGLEGGIGGGGGGLGVLCEWLMVRLGLWLGGFGFLFDGDGIEGMDVVRCDARSERTV